MSDTNHEHDQAVMDLADSNIRLDKIGQLVAKKAQLKADVARLIHELANARERLQKAEWDLQTLLNREGMRVQVHACPGPVAPAIAAETPAEPTARKPRKKASSNGAAGQA